MFHTTPGCAPARSPPPRDARRRPGCCEACAVIGARPSSGATGPRCGHPLRRAVRIPAARSAPKAWVPALRPRMRRDPIWRPGPMACACEPRPVKVRVDVLRFRYVAAGPSFPLHGQPFAGLHTHPCGVDAQVRAGAIPQWQAASTSPGNLVPARSVRPLVSIIPWVVVSSGAYHLRAAATRPSRTLDLTPGGGRQKGRAGHAALPGFVVDGFEQAGVEGDVDPPR